MSQRSRKAGVRVSGEKGRMPGYGRKGRQNPQKAMNKAAPRLRSEKFRLGSEFSP